MSVGVRVEDVKGTTLDYSASKGGRASPLREFFQFWRYPRSFSEPTVLADCSFFDVYIDYRFGSVPGHPGPPHPGMFADFFPDILGCLIGPAHTLLLFVKSTDPDYFDELGVAKMLLAPKGLRYALLSRPGLRGGRSPEPDVGCLIFEWPTESLRYVVENWFMCPQVSIEGYIGQGNMLGRTAELYFEPDTEATIRRLLRTIEIGFRIWTDNNGLFLLTDRYDIDGIRSRLQLPDLDRGIQEAAHRYDAGTL